MAAFTLIRCRAGYLVSLFPYLWTDYRDRRDGDCLRADIYYLLAKEVKAINLIDVAKELATDERCLAFLVRQRWRMGDS
jgi:hypothetical protein